MRTEIYKSFSSSEQNSGPDRGTILGNGDQIDTNRTKYRTPGLRTPAEGHDLAVAMEGYQAPERRLTHAEVQAVYVGHAALATARLRQAELGLVG